MSLTARSRGSCSRARSHHRRSESVFTSSATHSTWCVIGNRSKARSVAQRGSRARRSTPGRGPARPGRRRRTPRPAARGRRPARPPARRAPSRGGSRTTRSNGSSYDDGEHPVDAARARRGRPAARRLARGVLARAARSPSTATTRPVGPTASARNAREQPDAGVQVEHPLPRLRPQHLEHGLHQHPRRLDVRLPEAVGRRRRSRASPCAVRDGLERVSTPRAGGSRASAPRDQAVVDGDHLVGAVHAQPASAVRAGRRTASGCASAARVVAGDLLDDHRHVEAGQPGQLLADHRRLQAALARRGRRAGSRSRRSRPGRRTGTAASPGRARRRAPRRRRRARSGRRRCPR